MECGVEGGVVRFSNYQIDEVDDGRQACPESWRCPRKPKYAEMRPKQDDWRRCWMVNVTSSGNARWEEVLSGNIVVAASRQSSRPVNTAVIAAQAM